MNILEQPDHDAMDYIKRKLATDDEWLRRAISAIYSMQTTAEKNTEATLVHNGVGFNGADAEYLSSFAKQIANGSKLSARQLAIARRRMPKYARQLLKIARAKA